MRPRRATIDDVAAAAGVSVATVSRALRGLPNVASSTRDRVVAVATEFGYRPDPAAARLAAGRSTAITIVVPHLAGWYFATVVAGAEAVCAAEGYELSVICASTLDSFSRLVDVDNHIERRTDGLIAVDIPIADDVAGDLRARGVSVATIGTAGGRVPSVRIDDVAVGRLATDHLIELGHHRIALIGGLQHDPMNFEVPRRRALGYIEALAAAELDVDESMMVPGNFGIDDGRESMAALLNRSQPPTAVFLMSDEMAFGAIMEMRARGLVPGRDVSIVGVDDHEFARVVELTTVRQTVTEHGAAGARLVIEQLRRRIDVRFEHGSTARDGDAPPDHHAPVELVVRSTTGPAPMTNSRLA